MRHLPTAGERSCVAPLPRDSSPRGTRQDDATAQRQALRTLRLLRPALQTEVPVSQQIFDAGHSV